MSSALQEDPLLSEPPETFPGCFIILLIYLKQHINQYTVFCMYDMFHDKKLKKKIIL